MPHEAVNTPNSAVSVTTALGTRSTCNRGVDHLIEDKNSGISIVSETMWIASVSRLGCRRPQETQRFSQRAGTVGGQLSHSQPARENLHDAHNRDIGHRVNKQQGYLYDYLNKQDHGDQPLRDDKV